MQALIVAACAFVLAVVFGKLIIPALRALHAGQSIREIGPSWHNSKAGTPTMGGLIFIAAAALCTIAGGWRSMLAGRTFTCWPSRWCSVSSAFSMIS